MYRSVDKSLARPARKQTTAQKILSFIYLTYNYNWSNTLSLSIYIYIYIQGDSGGICNTLGNDIMCDSKQKSQLRNK